MVLGLYAHDLCKNAKNLMRDSSGSRDFHVVKYVKIREIFSKKIYIGMKFGCKGKGRKEKATLVATHPKFCDLSRGWLECSGAT